MIKKGSYAHTHTHVAPWQFSFPSFVWPTRQKLPIVESHFLDNFLSPLSCLVEHEHAESRWKDNEGMETKKEGEYTRMRGQQTHHVISFSSFVETSPDLSRTHFSGRNKSPWFMGNGGIGWVFRWGTKGSDVTATPITLIQRPLAIFFW